MEKNTSLNHVFIGQEIKEKLDASGMSYAQFARSINCSRTTLYSIFNSKSIDVERLITISKILDYDFFYEVYGIGGNPSNLSDSPCLLLPFRDGELELYNLSGDLLKQLQNAIAQITD